MSTESEKPSGTATIPENSDAASQPSGAPQETGAADKSPGWIGVDLDGTLAQYDRWRGVEHIGEPIEPMVERVKAWLAAGVEVRIFTARVHEQSVVCIERIQLWCVEYLGQLLPITNVKDFDMIELWDDRAMAMETNTGRVLGGASRIPEKYPAAPSAPAVRGDAVADTRHGRCPGPAFCSDNKSQRTFCSRCPDGPAAAPREPMSATTFAAPVLDALPVDERAEEDLRKLTNAASRAREPMASAACRECKGTGEVLDSNPIYRGWRYCDCPAGREKGARATQVAPEARVASGTAYKRAPSWCANETHDSQPHINNGDCAPAVPRERITSLERQLAAAEAEVDARVAEARTQERARWKAAAKPLAEEALRLQHMFPAGSDGSRAFSSLFAGIMSLPEPASGAPISADGTVKP